MTPNMWSLLVTCIIVFSMQPSNARPTSNNTSPLVHRECRWDDASDKFICDRYLPTLDQIVSRMKNTEDSGKASPGASAIFYTNLVDGDLTQDKRWEMCAWCAGWMENAGIKNWYSTWNAVDPAWFRKQDDYSQLNTGLLAQNNGGSPEQVQLNWVGCYNQGLAYAASETAYLFTRHDQEWSENSVWQMMEFWPLTREGGSVTKVYRVDPRRPDRGGQACAEPTVIWDRATNAERKELWKCPIK